MAVRASQAQASIPANPSQERLETLLFKATNPGNKIEDVNTIKQFCDCVCQSPDGSLLAARLLGHKIQSPQDQEALQALAVLEACVRSCGQGFHAEVGKFRFLNEMIKLVSPKYAGTRTPEHIKQKVVELLFTWTKEIPEEKKIVEAYEMLKSQGLVNVDPDYVNGAVFASSLPPRQAELDDAETRKLQKLLHSKNPEDIEQANRLIKGMVKKDEEKMEKQSKRAVMMTEVASNVKLLNEMLDIYNSRESNTEERELMSDLGHACEKLRPNLYRLAAEMDENDDSIGDILLTSDELTKVIDRYRDVIVLNKPDPFPKLSTPTPPPPGMATLSSTVTMDLGSPMSTNVDSLLDINISPSKTSHSSNSDQLMDSAAFGGLESLLVRKDLLTDNQVANPPLDLLSQFDIPAQPNVSPVMSYQAAANVMPMTDDLASSKKGLDDLDILGESLMKQNLPGNKETSFEVKRTEKLPLNVLMKQKELGTPDIEIKDLTNELPTTPVTNKVGKPKEDFESVSSQNYTSTKVNDDIKSDDSAPKTDLKVSDIVVEMSKISPNKELAPMIIQSEENGVSIVLHFTKNNPRAGVAVVVVTITNHQEHDISNIEFRAVVPKGCKVKLMPASGKSLPSFSPFSPPPAITQIMILGNSALSTFSLNYFLSYVMEEETMSDMGRDFVLPHQLWASSC